MKVIWNDIGLNYKIDLQLVDVLGSSNMLTFDTGAGATVFGINVLINEKLSESLDSTGVFNLLTLCNVKPKIFYSATNTRMAAFPCCMNNVLLGGEKLDKLYFYLTPGTENPDVALLGNDFIRYCSMSKGIDSNIEITGFDFESYERNFIDNIDGDVIFPIHSIYEEYERIESTKNLASAFQYLVTHPKKV